MHTTDAPPGETSEGPPPSLTTRFAALSGALAVGAALGASELVPSLIGSGRSLVPSIADFTIDTVPSAVAKWAIRVFGIYDKLALVIGILVVSLLIGAIVGRLAARRFWVALVGFVAFGALGLAAGLVDPLNDPTSVVAASVAAVVAGLAALAFLHRLGSGDRWTQHDRGRRDFFKGAGAVAALAVVGAGVGRWLVNRMESAALRADVILPGVRRPIAAPPAGAQVEGAVPVITPNDQFYKIDTAVMTPHVDPAGWSLMITGMVDTPYELTFDDLLELPMVERYITLSCVSNKVGGSLVGTAKWQGILLSDVLERAGIQSGATQIVGRSVDDFTVGFPTEAAFDGRDALIAVGMNGEPLPFDHGFPARLVVAGLYGYVSATKWLSEIELTTWEGFDAYWVPRGWSKEAPIKTQSRIDVPAANATLMAGPVNVAGVAWAPNKGIERVEVRVDDGAWQDADLGDSLSDDAWRQWILRTEMSAGSHTIQVRATDRTGHTQTEELAEPRPDGATGYHTRSVSVGVA